MSCLHLMLLSLGGWPAAKQERSFVEETLDQSTMSHSISKEPANGLKPVEKYRKIRPSSGESTLSALIPLAANSILKKKDARRLADGPLPFTPLKQVESCLSEKGEGIAMRPSSYTGFSRFNPSYAALDSSSLNFLQRKSTPVLNAVKEADQNVKLGENIPSDLEPVKKSDAPSTVNIPVRKSDASSVVIPVRSYNETNKSSAAINLTTKRELFFRDGTNSVSNGTTNGTTPVNTTTPSLLTSKEQTNIYGKENKDLDGEPTPRYKEREKEHHTNNIKDLDGYVGFANLPNQVYRKAVKKGFEFTLMVVGESGLGKSTLINSMFLSDIYSAEHPGPSHRIKKTVQVETTKALLKENGVNLTLTVVDTPGFGDAVDNSNCWQPVMDYIETKYEEYLNSESRVNRRTTPDNRVHCCLYFLSPSGHGLKPLDVEFMKRLHDKVNIIPLLAKADTMTPEECVSFKQKIINEISQHKIKIYEFPDGDDEEETKVQKPLKDRVPFAVVGSNTIIDINGKKVRGRKYPWGVAEVENMEHCDFIALRNMLMRTHMQDLKDITNNVHYENFRCRKLAGIGSDGKPLRVSSKNPLAQMEEEKKEREQKIKKTEQEMEQVFEMKVREKKQKLKDSEADLQRRHEQMKKSLEQQQSELDDKRKAFEKEKSTWEELNKASLEDMRRRSLESNSKEHVDSKDKKKERKKGLF
uniref:Septin-type G domain-containing protein n=1 Tax=Strigamia maritima TaxID=126957 RepID=T1IHJ1_STRMM